MGYNTCPRCSTEVHKSDSCCQACGTNRPFKGKENPESYEFVIRNGEDAIPDAETTVVIQKKGRWPNMDDDDYQPKFLPDYYSQEMESLYSVNKSENEVVKELKELGLIQVRE